MSKSDTGSTSLPGRAVHIIEKKRQAKCTKDIQRKDYGTNNIVANANK